MGAVVVVVLGLRAVGAVDTVIVEGARESATEPAPRRGRDPAAPPKGITRTTSRAKQLRDVAKLDARRLQEHRRQWWRAEEESRANSRRRERCCPDLLMI